MDTKKSILSTSSPEGIQIASKITPTRLAELLIRKGPLPIRHITGQLANEVLGFDQLSLSKQRRLIMSAMEQGDKTNNVVFEKIGWGQWAVRKIDSDYIVTEGTEETLYHGKEDPEEKAQISVKDLRNQPNLKLGWTKKQDGKSRRESITNKKPNLHNMNVPHDVLSSSAITSDSDQDDEDDDLIDTVIGGESSDESSDDDELFEFENELGLTKKKSPPIKFANRVPLKLSPPPNPHSRRKSSSSHSVNKNTNYNKHQIFNRSRLNSLDNLDNYIILSAKNSNGSFSSPPPPPPNMAAAALSGSPLSSWSSNNLSKSPEAIMASMNGNRRKSSFNESHIRSTLSAASIPRNSSNPPRGSNFTSSNNSTHFNLSSSTNSPAIKPDNRDSLSDTDEEDWATIGAESLRRSSKDKMKDEKDAKAAAFALVDLMSV